MTEPDGYTETQTVETNVNEDGQATEQTVTENVQLDTTGNSEGE